MRAPRGWVWSVSAASLFWIALFAFGTAQADYSQLTNAISELGAVGVPYALAWNALGFILPGLMLAACGLAIATDIDGRRGALPWLLSGSGMAFAGTGVFPAVMRDGSPVLQAPSTVGHVVMLLLSSVGWLLALGVLLRTITRAPRLRRLLAPFATITVVALSGLAANVLHHAIPPLAHRPGLAQRLGFVGYFLWFVSMSLIARSADQRSAPPGSQRRTAGSSGRGIGSVREARLTRYIAVRGHVSHQLPSCGFPEEIRTLSGHGGRRPARVVGAGPREVS
jgi:hypothetical membrane protein